MAGFARFKLFTPKDWVMLFLPISFGIVSEVLALNFSQIMDYFFPTGSEGDFLGVMFYFFLVWLILAIALGIASLWHPLPLLIVITFALSFSFPVSIVFGPGNTFVLLVIFLSIYGACFGLGRLWQHFRQRTH